jgi:replication initiation protein RepC
MEQQLVTTPTGRRPMTLAMIRTQQAIHDCTSDEPINKWEVFRAIRECKAALGLNDRTLSVLNALLTFRQRETMALDESLIVFPSNRLLSLRANGIPESTLRRHLAALVEAGLIIRRDSPNGKRYARGGGGDLSRTAFGFDLSPIVARAPTLLAMATELRREEIERRRLREQISVRRRDVGKLLELVQIERPSECLDPIRARLAVHTQRITSRTPVDHLRSRLQLLIEIGNDVMSLLPDCMKTDEMSATDAQNERHIQESKILNLLTENEVDLEIREVERLRSLPDPVPINFTLPSVLSACPDVEMYSKTGISSWNDFARTASLVRCALAISNDTWEDAQETLGLIGASVVVAAILQRAETIKTPGAYLRALTKKALQSKFSPTPMLQSLTKARLRADRVRHQSKPPVSAVVVRMRAHE